MRLGETPVKLLSCSTSCEPFAILLGRMVPHGCDGDAPSCSRNVRVSWEQTIILLPVIHRKWIIISVISQKYTDFKISYKFYHAHIVQLPSYFYDKFILDPYSLTNNEFEVFEYCIMLRDSTICELSSNSAVTCDHQL